MKFKNLSLAVFSAFMLSACGGGSSSDSNPGTGTGTGTGSLNLTTPSFQQWTTFFVDEYSDETLDYEIEQNTFDQGNLYFKVEETTGWDESNTFSLTENGLYDTGNMHPKYGQLNGIIKTNATTWQLAPYSSINSKDLQTIIKFKEIDISGKNIAPILSPNNYLTLKYNLLDTYTMGELGEKFYTLTSNAKFPANSKCIQFQDISNSKEYIELYKYSLEEDIQDYLKTEWADVSTDSKNYSKKTFKDAIAYLDLREDQQWGLEEYKSKYYEVDYHPAGKEYDFKNLLSELQSLITSAKDNHEKQVRQELYDLTQNACNAFNDVASSEIRKQMNNVISK